MKLGSASRRVTIPQAKSSAPQQSLGSREEQVRKKAYEFYEKRGCQPGHDWEDWFEAEKAVSY